MRKLSIAILISILTAACTTASQVTRSDLPPKWDLPETYYWAAGAFQIPYANQNDDSTDISQMTVLVHAPFFLDPVSGVGISLRHATPSSGQIWVENYSITLSILENTQTSVPARVGMTTLYESEMSQKDFAAIRDQLDSIRFFSSGTKLATPDGCLHAAYITLEAYIDTQYNLTARNSCQEEYVSSRQLAYKTMLLAEKYFPEAKEALTRLRY